MPRWAAAKPNWRCAWRSRPSSPIRRGPVPMSRWATSMPTTGQPDYARNYLRCGAGHRSIREPIALKALSSLDRHGSTVQRRPMSVLVLDFGSQVTQLIARRVREAGVYCEIVPYNKAEEALAKKPRAIILSGGPASVYRRGCAARAASGVRAGRAGAGHLLWRDDDERPAGRQGRRRPQPRIRPRRHPRASQVAAARRLGGIAAASRCG